MRKLFVNLVAIACITGITPSLSFLPFTSSNVADAKDTVLINAIKNHRSNIQVQGSGQVTRILADDQQGNPHQRFLIKLSSGQTLLIAHNIAIAPRINNIEVGDIVQFYGEYEWNNKGGVIHWTHHDPARNHTNGWLFHEGTKYQ